MDPIFTATLSCAASALAAILSAIAISKINKGERKRDDAAHKRDAEHECIAAIARQKLVESSAAYQRQGWMPHEAKNSYHALYESYHGMGENGLIDLTVSAALALPEVEPMKEEDDA